MYVALSDNAYDPGCEAKVLKIDHETINSLDCVSFLDDGYGMNESQLKQMMG